MKKKKLILLALLLTISTSGCGTNEKNEKQSPYSEYSKGNVYIGNIDYLNTLDVNENDILILDKRDDEDPDIKIYDSYLILDSNVIEEILDIILAYEKENPSNWNRTKSTMRTEWFFHNLAYYLNYQRDRTKDVDLNNYDEENYKNNNYLSLVFSKK